MKQTPPKLRPVEPDGYTFPSNDPQFTQPVDQAGSFGGRAFLLGDEWIGGVLYPDHLGISFAERVADLPQFALQVENLTGRRIDSIRGTASKALPGDPPLLGDWIESGTLDADRLLQRFEMELGGVWTLSLTLKDPTDSEAGHDVSIDRGAGERS